MDVEEEVKVDADTGAADDADDNTKTDKFHSKLSDNHLVPKEVIVKHWKYAPSALHIVPSGSPRIRKYFINDKAGRTIHYEYYIWINNDDFIIYVFASLQNQGSNYLTIIIPDPQVENPIEYALWFLAEKNIYYRFENLISSYDPHAYLLGMSKEQERYHAQWRDEQHSDHKLRLAKKSYWISDRVFLYYRVKYITY